MSRDSGGEVTRILQVIGQGDPRASADLMPLVYTELRKLAHTMMIKVPAGHTLQTTALVHEAYVRLVGNDDPQWDGRGHFFGAAAQAMRRILVDQARRKLSRKRGGDRKRVDIDDLPVVIEPPCDDVLALNEALERLESSDPRAAKVVMLRHFAGLTVEETAAAMKLSPSTVERDWRFARTVLYTWLREPEREGPPGPT